MTALRSGEVPSLETLFFLLRNAGYKINTSQLIDAAHLLTSAATRFPSLPPDRMAGMLTCIFSTSPREQEGILPVVSDWLTESVQITAPDPDPEQPRKPLDELSRKTSSRPFSIIGGVLLVISIIGAFHYVHGPLLLFQDNVTTTPNKRDTRILKGPLADNPSDQPGGDTDARKVLAVEATKIIAASVPLLTFVLWYFWRRRNLRFWVNRRAAMGPVRLEGLRVANSPLSFQTTPAFRRIGRMLRRPKTQVSNEIDMPFTIERCARDAGVVTPVYVRRPYSPEHLVLIHSEAPKDQLAAFMAEGIACLRAEGVYIDLYQYIGDPRTCFAEHGAVQLSDLAARHSSSRLIIIGDGAELFDPVRGTCHPWLNIFSAWPERALLSHKDSSAWDWNEAELIRNGFLVLPATEEGIQVLAQAFSTHGDRLIDAGAELPTAMAGIPDLPKLATRRSGPETGAASELSSLQQYLGPFCFNWLYACALYPVLNWNLTRILGVKLAEEGRHPPPPWNFYVAMLRLPWFRNGYLPDKLRESVIAQQPLSHGQRIQMLVYDLLLTAISRPDSSAFVPVVSTAKVPTKHLLSGFINAEPPESPMRDKLFVHALDAASAAATDFPIPKIIGKMLGNSLERPVSTFFAGMASIVAAGVLWVIATFGIGWPQGVMPTTLDFSILGFILLMSIYSIIVSLSAITTRSMREELANEFARRRAIANRGRRKRS